MAQQRTSALRRNKPNIYGVQYSTVDWVFDSYTGNQVFFRIDQPPGTQVTDFEGYTLNGVPAIFDIHSGQYATAAVFQVPYLRVTFPTTQSYPLGYRLANVDPAFRGRFGEYLCIKSVIPQVAPPSPVNITIGNATISGNDIIFGGFSGANQLAMRNLPVINNTTQGAAAISVTTDGLQIVATFAAPPMSGDSVDVDGGSTNWLNPTGGNLNGGTFLLP
tara:strand:- start:31 stop:687 length:657 start_codon:yes stop_codon:yes gene_type:complete